MLNLVRTVTRPAVCAAMLVSVCLPVYASGTDVPVSLANDRQFAESHLEPQQQQMCLADFSKRVSSKPVELSGNFHFNEMITRNVYDMLYWKDGGHGVAFTAPVKIIDPDRGEVATNVACFYAVQSDKLVFQHAQQVAWRF